MKYIKNNDSVSHVWVGQTIPAGEYYEIQPLEELRWTNNSELLVAISSETAIVAKADDGNNDILDTNLAINYLKGSCPREVISEPSNAYSLQMNSISTTVTKTTTNSADFKVENYTNFPNPGQNESYTYKYIWGGTLITQDAVHGDYVSFKIVDVDNIFGYGGGFVASRYIVKCFVDPHNSMEFGSLAPGEIPIGLYLRCKYTSVGTGNNVKIWVNYKLNTKGS